MVRIFSNLLHGGRGVSSWQLSNLKIWQRNNKSVTVIVNKNIWMCRFGNEVPCEEQLIDDLQQLRKRLLQILNTKNGFALKKTHSQLQNSLKRRHKMLAAVKDAQPWAWMLYPSQAKYNKTARIGYFK